MSSTRAALVRTQAVSPLLIERPSPSRLRVTLMDRNLWGTAFRDVAATVTGM